MPLRIAVLGVGGIGSTVAFQLAGQGQHESGRTTAGLLWSLSRVKSSQDILATGATESQALVDTMVATAPQANPPVRIRKIEAMKPPERYLSEKKA